MLLGHHLGHGTWTMSRRLKGRLEMFKGEGEERREYRREREREQ